MSVSIPLSIAQIARVCHEANRTYCDCLGDHSQPQWEAAPAWQRESAIAGVRFHLANPTAGSEHSHNEWMRAKLADGWKYGPVKDPLKREHPCIVPFLDLPPEQQAKDSLFLAIVHSLEPLLQPEDRPR
jgi:hypothetical protein